MVVFVAMSMDEAREKFTSLVVFSGRSAVEADEIFQTVMKLESSLGALPSLISGARNHD